MSDEPLDYVAKAMVTKTVSDKIDADVKPGRGRSDVMREALDFYFEHRDKIIASPKQRYRTKSKK